MYRRAGAAGTHARALGDPSVKTTDGFTRRAERADGMQLLKLLNMLSIRGSREV